MTSGNELRAFLTSRRAAISPQEAGLPVPATTRRVKGLRREEVAILAGVSVDYYVKLEQGRAGNVSDQVIEAVGRALRLDDVESRHLRSLLRPGSGPAPGVVKARPALLSMVHALNVPAVIHGPHLEVLGANHAAKALIADFDAMPVAQRNTARWTFLDPRARIVYPDWSRVAGGVVAFLRASSVDADDEVLRRLVAELSAASDEFARMWAAYRLSDHRYGVKRFFNEVVGELRLNFHTMRSPDGRPQSVVIYSADTGSPSEEKLRLLSSWTAASPAPPPR
ncbi:helix-turn-helix domain-containing protein [Dactylosporangium aurantiacum]|uniref:Helix-turn-helix domain-containing protein n=1 Tax=Dactylosporangium aurantiacum TaxID=35754 RepID=A0A9Q9MII1_9ACTN|nr:helix-turn-helix transcriptional regulator [Dactylosporangium aurantiacum]MDG6108064.1 helix-turn-helix transcriptional regulator [Dactylosporangium aurantiacum]UWZ53696.1 helix-turn-helix domain-containing protein [Dactylosporangium aurantiacum]